MKRLRLWKSLLALCLLVVPVGCGSEEVQQEVVVEQVEEVREPYYLDDAVILELQKELKEDKKVNEDIKAIVHFQNGLLHQPVAYDAKDLNKYLYTDWKTGVFDVNGVGSITLDTENDLEKDDYMNVILYGHYCYEVVDKERNKVFTPLAQLMDEKNYEDNKYLALLVGNELRYYVVGCVYELPTVQINSMDATPEDLRFNYVYYDEEYFKTYVDAIQEHQYYETDVTFTYGDRLLTMETCIENNKPAREIVVCKELARFDLS